MNLSSGYASYEFFHEVWGVIFFELERRRINDEIALPEVISLRYQRESCPAAIMFVCIQ